MGGFFRKVMEVNTEEGRSRENSRVRVTCWGKWENGQSLGRRREISVGERKIKYVYLKNQGIIIN